MSQQGKSRGVSDPPRRHAALPRALNLGSLTPRILVRSVRSRVSIEPALHRECEMSTSASQSCRRPRTATCSTRCLISQKKIRMPLIKPRTRGKQLVKHRTRLDRENNETLYAYAHFLGESTEYVLNQVID